MSKCLDFTGGILSYKGIPSANIETTCKNGSQFLRMITELNAMQSELELAMTILKRIRYDFHPPRWKEIADFIAKHETNISDKGDTMETKPETQNILEIRSVTENEIALFFDGERCSGDHHPSGAFGQIYLKLGDYVTSLESRLEELEPLAEAVESVENNALCAGYSYRGKHPEGYWYVWNPDEEEVLTGSGNSIPAAIADYREKHSEPEEDEVTRLLMKARSYLGNCPQSSRVGRDIDIYLARKKGDSHD